VNYLRVMIYPGDRADIVEATKGNSIVTGNRDDTVLAGERQQKERLMAYLQSQGIDPNF
jgi:hypothetical protein